MTARIEQVVYGANGAMTSPSNATKVPRPASSWKARSGQGEDQHPGLPRAWLDRDPRVQVPEAEHKNGPGNGSQARSTQRLERLGHLPPSRRSPGPTAGPRTGATRVGVLPVRRWQTQQISRPASGSRWSRARVPWSLPLSLGPGLQPLAPRPPDLDRGRDRDGTSAPAWRASAITSAM